MSKANTINDTLEAPLKPEHLPDSIQWLAGEGCGSWFLTEELENNYVISRYDPEGKLECKGIFAQVTGKSLNLQNSFQVTYLSHCAEVNILQNNESLKFKLLKRC